jgi:uncharacterized protein YecT (DUF1311 family)
MPTSSATAGRMMIAVPNSAGCDQRRTILRALCQRTGQTADEAAQPSRARLGPVWAGRGAKMASLMLDQLRRHSTSPIRFALALFLGCIGHAAADELDSWCPQVKLPSSIAICSDPELRALTIARQHAFNDARTRIGDAKASVLLADQNAWLASYPRACGLTPDAPPSLPLSSQLKDCMARAGRARIAYSRLTGCRHPRQDRRAPYPLVLGSDRDLIAVRRQPL